MTRYALVLVFAACTPPATGGGQVPAWVSDTSSYGPTTAPAAPTLAPAASLVEPYRDDIAKILAAARADRGAYQKLAELTDTIGARLAGSPELERAIVWAAAAMTADGHLVRTEKVMVPHWKRGFEDAQLIAPVARKLSVLGLGGSISTPKGGITAPVVVVQSFDELDARAAELKGAIVLYDVAMRPYDKEKGSDYGTVVKYRSAGASRAAKHGAVAVLVRSATERSLRTPHTGAMTYADDAPKIPAAAITLEDSSLIARLAAKGPVRVKLDLQSKTLPDAPSANVIGELRGKDKPEEVVLLGAHLDSWDVGQGAHDDGAGCVQMMQAITLLKKLGLQPRRTIRVVLFTNEENGLRGAKAYAVEHARELGNHVFALEADAGGFAPGALGVGHKTAADRVAARVGEIAQQVASTGLTKVFATDHVGADISPLLAGGVPSAGLYTDGARYFDYHHTDADTLDKIDPVELNAGLGAIAVLAYVLADLPDRIDLDAVPPSGGPGRPGTAGTSDR
ncbi:MAG: M20/M25/M40 family metallo-hydrolase [Kofleriaceae bacterium]|nr:M20/M25/M40 family metallo-hydrolase [Kofleriaceae bacterium]